MSIFGPNPDKTPKPIMYVGRVRRDGKIPVQYVYPLSGRRFLKIVTAERFKEDSESGDYTVL